MEPAAGRGFIGAGLRVLRSLSPRWSSPGPARSSSAATLADTAASTQLPEVHRPLAPRAPSSKSSPRRHRSHTPRRPSVPTPRGNSAAASAASTVNDDLDHQSAQLPPQLPTLDAMETGRHEFSRGSPPWMSPLPPPRGPPPGGPPPSCPSPPPSRGRSGAAEEYPQRSDAWQAQAAVQRHSTGVAGAWADSASLAAPAGTVGEHAQKLLDAVFEFPVAEQAASFMLDANPELSWLSQCVQRSPLPPCWSAIESRNSCEATRYVDMGTGSVTEVQPLLDEFIELARMMLFWRSNPDQARIVADALTAKCTEAFAEAVQLRQAWMGPYMDPKSGAEFWHCSETHRSTWGDPGAASDFLARVAEKLRQALPVDLADCSPSSTQDREIPWKAPPSKYHPPLPSGGTTSAPAKCNMTSPSSPASPASVQAPLSRSFSSPSCRGAASSRERTGRRHDHSRGAHTARQRAAAGGLGGGTDEHSGETLGDIGMALCDERSRRRRKCQSAPGGDLAAEDQAQQWWASSMADPFDSSNPTDLQLRPECRRRRPESCERLQPLETEAQKPQQQIVQCFKAFEAEMQSELRPVEAPSPKSRPPTRRPLAPLSLEQRAESSCPDVRKTTGTPKAEERSMTSAGQENSWSEEDAEALRTKNEAEDARSKSQMSHEPIASTPPLLCRVDALSEQSSSGDQLTPMPTPTATPKLAEIIKKDAAGTEQVVSAVEAEERAEETAPEVVAPAESEAEELGEAEDPPVTEEAPEATEAAAEVPAEVSEAASGIPGEAVTETAAVAAAEEAADAAAEALAEAAEEIVEATEPVKPEVLLPAKLEVAAEQMIEPLPEPVVTADTTDRLQRKLEKSESEPAEEPAAAAAGAAEAAEKEEAAAEVVSKKTVDETAAAKQAKVSEQHAPAPEEDAATKLQVQGEIEVGEAAALETAEEEVSVEQAEVTRKCPAEEMATKAVVHGGDEALVKADAKDDAAVEAAVRNECEDQAATQVAARNVEDEVLFAVEDADLASEELIGTAEKSSTEGAGVQAELFQQAEAGMPIDDLHTPVEAFSIAQLSEQIQSAWSTEEVGPAKELAQPVEAPLRKKPLKRDETGLSAATMCLPAKPATPTDENALVEKLVDIEPMEQVEVTALTIPGVAAIETKVSASEHSGVSSVQRTCALGKSATASEKATLSAQTDVIVSPIKSVGVEELIAPDSLSASSEQAKPVGPYWLALPGEYVQSASSTEEASKELTVRDETPTLEKIATPTTKSTSLVELTSGSQKDSRDEETAEAGVLAPEHSVTPVLRGAQELQTFAEPSVHMNTTSPCQLAPVEVIASAEVSEESLQAEEEVEEIDGQALLADGTLARQQKLAERRRAQQIDEGDLVEEFLKAEAKCIEAALQEEPLSPVEEAQDPKPAPAPAPASKKSDQRAGTSQPSRRRASSRPGNSSSQVSTTPRTRRPGQATAKAGPARPQTPPRDQRASRPSGRRPPPARPASVGMASSSGNASSGTHAAATRSSSARSAGSLGGARTATGAARSSVQTAAAASLCQGGSARQLARDNSSRRRRIAADGGA